MAELKTIATDASVEKFLAGVENEKRRDECFTVLALMKKITGEEPKMWGSSIVGFGTYHYKSERSRQEGDWFYTGFSPRKQALTVYVMAGFTRYDELMAKLGKYKTVFQIAAVTCLLMHYEYHLFIESPYLLVNFHQVGMGLLWVALLITVWSGIDYFRKFFRQVFFRMA